MRYEDVMERLASLADSRNVEGMARFGISTTNTLGISVTTLRAIAKEIGRDHDLALRLWDSGVHEARMLATLVDDPRAVTEEQAERWALDFDSWDICDGCCMLFRRTPFAWEKAREWSARPEEFVKRAAFALMATLGVHNKQVPDERFLELLPIIEREAGDERNFVRKAVNWALRQVGKRNPRLNLAAVETARRIRAGGTKSGRWIAADALRELTGPAVRARLGMEG